MFYSVLAVLFMLPAAVLPWMRGDERGWPFWRSLVIATLWPLVMVWRLMTGQWPTSLSADLWVTIAATLSLYLVISAVSRQAWRLSVLVMPYVVLLAVLACLSASTGGEPLNDRAPTAWVNTHIVVSVSTLALLTLAAAAALACFIQARALKNKRPNRLSRLLPSVNDSDMLYEKLLILSECILAVGVATGMATEFGETGKLLVFDHKTLLSLLAFVLIGGLIGGRRWGGVRGQWAVRGALLAYSFVLLGYFGVKFVKQVLLS